MVVLTTGKPRRPPRNAVASLQQQRHQTHLGGSSRRCCIVGWKSYPVFVVTFVAALTLLTTTPSTDAAFGSVTRSSLEHIRCRRTVLSSMDRVHSNRFLKWSHSRLVLQQKSRGLKLPWVQYSSASSSSSSSSVSTASLPCLNATQGMSVVELPTENTLLPSDTIRTTSPVESETEFPRTITASNVPTYDAMEAAAAVVATSVPESSPPSSSSSSFAKEDTAEYTRGLWTIFGITLLFASYSPVLHVAFTSADGSAASMAPPVLFLNAAVSVAALIGVGFGAPFLEATTPLPSSYQQKQGFQKDPLVEQKAAVTGGLELGLWKFLGTVCNIFGLSLTTASHGAFLIQLTTLIVPVVQGIMGVPIPKQVQASIVLALTGVFLFTQDGAGADTVVTATMALGDALCVLAAVFYATYDLRLFEYGSQVRPRQLVTYKIAAQAFFSTALLVAVGWHETVDFVQSCATQPVTADHAGAVLLLVAVIAWAGAVINGIAPFLQVGGQQAIGPTRAQTIYASQPLWASLLAFGFLGETIGMQGLVGGAAFLVALFLAATAEAPSRDCGQENCEIK